MELVVVDHAPVGEAQEAVTILLSAGLDPRADLRPRAAHRLLASTAIYVPREQAGRAKRLLHQWRHGSPAHGWWHAMRDGWLSLATSVLLAGLLGCGATLLIGNVEVGVFIGIVALLLDLRRVGRHPVGDEPSVAMSSPPSVQ